MKEIDFLPEWYRSDRRRRISFRIQYIALCFIFAVMVGWNFIAVHSESGAAAEYARLASGQKEAKAVSMEFAGVKQQVSDLQKKVDVLERIDSRIDVAGVLAEISFLIEERIVLREVDLIAARFADRQESKTNGGSTVRVAASKVDGKGVPPLGSVKFEVAITGVASDAGDVAKLVCKLEDSPYFYRVVPSFSQNRKIKEGTSASAGSSHISEFEIVCCLANYRENETRFAKETKDENSKK